MLQAAAILATVAAAVAFVAGVGAYLYVRFTQHRSQTPAKKALPGKSTEPDGSGGLR